MGVDPSVPYCNFKIIGYADTVLLLNTDVGIRQNNLLKYQIFRDITKNISIKNFTEVVQLYITTNCTGTNTLELNSR